MDMACVCLALDSLLGIHTTVTLAVQRAAEFLLTKISFMKVQRRGEGRKGKKGKGKEKRAERVEQMIIIKE